MKKIILAAFVTICSLGSFASDPGVDEKVLEAFNKTFQQAEDVSWSTSGDNFQVKFTQNEIASRVYYDKEGNILKTYRYYKEQGLPLLVFSKVKMKYSEQKIHGVTEVSSDEGTYYHITLEDGSNWTEIKADSYGAIEQVRKFKKG
jgi:hypothetical protein